VRQRAVTVVGIGDDGCVGLSARGRNAIAAAQVLVGGERHLAFVPEFTGERIVVKGAMAAVLERVAAAAEDANVCVLASGDPLFFGIGAAIVARVGAAHVEIIPQPSSMQLAFARAGLRWEDAAIISVHGRPLTGVVARLRARAKAALLTDEERSPARIAAHLVAHGDAGWRAWVCERLGGPGERVRAFASLEALAAVTDVDPLNVLLLERSDPDWRPPPAIPFLPEEDFAKRVPKLGLITKREIRLLSLAAMALAPDATVWDIGAGSGSVAIEAGLLAPHGQVFAIEVDPECVAMARDNARAHGADNVTIVAGRAPDALADLPDPDAVFVGGSKGSMAAIVDVALARLRPRGRLVVNAITLDNAAEVYQALRGRGLTPEVSLVQVSRAAPLASYLRYEALNPIQIFTVTRPEMT
jgi:precorrin-6Y C5,15-methyltransferase (decarboxylating)